MTFLAALAVLLTSAHSGQGAMKIWVVFAIFVAATTVWVRGQYADSLDGRQWVIPYWVGSVLAGVAVPALALAIVAVNLDWHPEWPDFGLLGMCSVVAIYLVIGSAVTQIRQTCSIRVRGRAIPLHRWGALLTVAGMILAVGGAALLGWVNWIAGLVPLGLGVIVLVPAGMALGSEQAIRWLCRKDDHKPWLWGFGAGGLVLFAGTTFLAVEVSNSAWLTPVMVVLGLFVLAMVSTTNADVAAVMAAIALMGITPPQLPESETPHPVRDNQHVLVALGDSYMSGEGASVFYEGGDHRKQPWCNRAPTAWAVLSIQDTKRFDGLKFLACAGAQEEHVINQVDDYHKDQSREGYQPEMVVVSLGGNDAGFARIAEMCLAPYNCDELKKVWLGMADQVSETIDSAYQKVSDEFPQVPVVVVPYPIPIMPAVKGCPQVAFSRSERKFIGEFTDTLNQSLHRAADKFRFHYLAAMQNALADEHLQLCDPANHGRPGINFIGLRSVHGVAEQRFNPLNWTHLSLHPNEQGHRAMRKVFRDWLEHKGKEPLSPRTTVAPGPGPTVAPSCEIEKCKSQARRWEARQVGKRLILKWLWLIISGVAGGAWLVGVAFFAWRRRVYAACG